MDSEKWVLVSIPKDNSWAVVPNHNVQCDFESVRIGEEVIVYCRSRDTVKFTDYNAIVLRIDGK